MSMAKRSSLSRLPACIWVLAALASPAAARSADGQSAFGREVSGAAAIASAYGAITSTYRTVAHNRAVGGVANSYHLQGRAIDVARKPGVSHDQIVAALRRAGYVMIESLDEGDHSHFAFAAAPGGSEKRVVPAKSTEPARPAPPPLLADKHGTLRIDLAPAGQIIER